VGCWQRLVLHHRVPRWSVNGAKNKAGLMTSTVMVAKTASLWASLASCAEKKWQKTLNKLGDSYRIGKKNRAAAAPVCALLTRGSKLNNRLTQRERRHLAAVKEMPCGVCGCGWTLGCPPHRARAAVPLHPAVLRLPSRNQWHTWNQGIVAGAQIR
jgi:hypothetical protein